MIPFGALIRESRESRGVSLRSLALAVELTPGELRAIEGNWPKIKFHALREHAGLVFQAKM